MSVKQPYLAIGNISMPANSSAILSAHQRAEG